MNKIVFPFLSHQELFSQLKLVFNFNFLQEDDLTKPKPETFKQILMRLFIESDQLVTYETFLLSAEEKALARYPDLIENSVSILKVYKYLILASDVLLLKDMDVRLNDILFPEPKRVRFLLSSLVNYIKFLYEFNRVLLKSGEINNEKESNLILANLKANAEDLRKEVKILKDFSEKNREIIKKKEEELSDYETEKRNLQNEKDLVLKRVNCIENNLNSEKESLKEIILELDQEEKKETELRSKIVADPYRFISELSEKKIEFEKVNTNLENSKEQLMKVQMEVERRSEVINILKSKLEYLSEYLIKKNEEMIVAGNDIKNCFSQNDVLKRKISDEIAKSAKLEQEINSKKALVQMEEMNRDTILTRLKDQIYREKERLENVKKERPDNRETISGLKRSQESVYEEIKRLNFYLENLRDQNLRKRKWFQAKIQETNEISQKVINKGIENISKLLNELSAD